MMEISGATRDAAAEALATSAARRRPRFLVFHVVDSRLVLVVEGAVSSAETMFSWATDAPGFPATVSRLPMVCVFLFSFFFFVLAPQEQGERARLGLGGESRTKGLGSSTRERGGGWHEERRKEKK